MSTIQRRDFIKKTALAAAGGSALIFGCGEEKKGQAPAVHTDQKYEWRMVTTWPPHFPILGEGADRFAKYIEEMSGGRMKIQVYGGGELIPALESFDAVSQGVAELGHGASYYWAGKAPAAPFFTSIPFGMNTQQTYAWLYYADGLKLWEKVYAPFNLLPLPCGNTGGQMGGWFNKQINSVSDLKGLKMRIPGIGGKVITKAGGSAILSSGGEIYTNLERGVIDATEWVGPYHDYLMGFPKIAKYYYYPGWQEPTAVMELIVNKSAFTNLPNDLQVMIKTAARSANVEFLSEFEEKNEIYLRKILEEENTTFLEFPTDVISAFKKYSKEVISEITEGDSLSREVYDSYSKFQPLISKWSSIAEKNYAG